MIKDKYLQKIGNLIAENRQKQGLTQTQLAEAIGTSQSAINRIENGGQNISIESVASIARASWAREVSEFLSFDDERPR